MTNIPLLRTLNQKVDPQHTALLVVDMQNDFWSEGGFVHRLGMDLSGMHQVITRISHLVGAARAARVPVIHLRSHFDLAFLLPPMVERLERKQSPPYCVAGTWGADFVAPLQPAANDVVITKHRYSGFYATDLDIVLRSRGIQTVVLTGTATNNCVDGTGRDAFYNGYYVVLVADATVAGSRALHEAALQTADHAYAVIATSEEIVGIWSGRPVAASDRVVPLAT